MKSFLRSLEALLPRRRAGLNAADTPAIIQLSEQDMRHIVENHSAVMLLIEPASGRIMSANRAACNFYGYSFEMLTQMSVNDINCLSPEQVAAERKKALNKQKQSFIFDHRLASGEIRTVETFTSPVSIQGQTLLFSIIHDITDRKQAEQALRQSEEKYRATIDGVQDVIHVIDADMNILLYNKEFARRLSEYNINEPPDGKNLFALCPFISEATRREYQAVMETGAPFYSEESNIYNGKTLWTETRKIPIQDQDEKTERILTIIRDITEKKQAEQAIKHSHDLMRYIIEHNRSAVAVLDRELKYIYVSQRYLQDYKIQEKDVIGKRHYEVFTDLPPRVIEVHKRVLAGEVVSNDDDPFPRGDGTLDWTRWECRPWYEADGAVGGIILYTEVITERKRVEEALRLSEARFRAIFEQGPDGMLIIDPESGRITEFNDLVCRQLGYTRQEFSQLTLADIEVVENAAQVQAHTQRVMAQGYDTFETQHRAKQGEIRDVQVTAQVIDLGQNVILMSIWRDITERKRMEQALRESEEKYRLIVENQQDLLVKTDPQGRLLFVNPAYCDLFDKTEEELLGNSYTPLVHPDDIPVVEKAVAELFTPPYECAYEERAITRHGWRWLSWAAKAILDENGAVTALLGSGRDITERKTAEAKITEQLEELRRWQNITLGRESRILELKREVNELLNEAGRAKRYDSASETTDG